MQFSEEKSTHPFVFQRVDAHALWVNDTCYSHSLIITAEPELHAWPVTILRDLTPALLAPLLLGNPDVVLLGTGSRPAVLPPALLMPFYDKRVGFEAMSTPAAARTYNVLANEGRRVAIGILL